MKNPEDMFDDVAKVDIPIFCKKCGQETPHSVYSEGKYKVRECDFCNKKTIVGFAPSSM